MLRSLALASLGLFLLAGPAAARGDGPAGGGRRADAKASGSAKAERAPQPAFLLRRVAATMSVRPVATTPAAGPAACGRVARGGAASRCRGAQMVNWGGWAQGLPPALGVQAQECPSGTMATLAEGHDDIVRCIPI